MQKKRNAEWLKEVDFEMENVNIQENAEITKENVTKQLRKMPNWKVQGLDRKGFWHKRFTNQHQRLTEE